MDVGWKLKKRSRLQKWGETCRTFKYGVQERGVWSYPPSHVVSSLHRIILSGSDELNRLHLDPSDQSDPLLLRERSARKLVCLIRIAT